MSWDYVFLSPHLDDVALSCGGYVHRLTREGKRVLIVSVFAAGPSGDTPLSPLAEELHGVWNLEENVVHIRRREDQAACKILGAHLEQWDFLDALYRFGQERALYPELRSLFTCIDPSDEPLIDQLAQRLRVFSESSILAPIAAGHHVDHQIVRQACETLETDLRYYEDYPYARRRRVLSKAMGSRRLFSPETVSLEERDLEAKVKAIACYESQLATAWQDQQAMERDIEKLARKRHGERLWRRRV